MMKIVIREPSDGIPKIELTVDADWVIEVEGQPLIVDAQGRQFVRQEHSEEPKSVFGADRPIVVFDLETTGTSPNKDRIIQFSAQKLNEKLEVVDELDISMNPGYPISPGASRVHGWTNKDLEDSPPFKKMAPKIVKFLKDCDFCGHNLVGFDLKMLMAEFERHTKFKVNTAEGGRRLIDTLKVSRKMRRGGHRLAECLTHYCGEEIEDAHDGLADVKATVKVLRAMLEQEKIDLNQADRVSRGLRTSLRK